MERRPLSQKLLAGPTLKSATIWNLVKQTSHFHGININTYEYAGTQDISISDLNVDGNVVRLIDTPGFNDSERTDTDILDLIGKYLYTTYAAGVQLTGIILLQSVTGNKIMGSEARRLRLFKMICGPDAFSHVIIVTTMWSDLSNKTMGEERVRERINKRDFWNDMIDKGAQVAPHDNTKQSAINIVRQLVGKTPVPLQMQTELEKGNGTLLSTSVGKQLQADLNEDTAKILAELKKTNEDLVRNAQVSKEELEAEIQELRKMLNIQKLQQEKLEKKSVSNFLVVLYYLFLLYLFSSSVTQFSIPGSVPQWLTALCSATGAGVSMGANLGFCQIL